VRASEIMFGGGLEGVTETVFKDVVGEVPTREIDREKLAGARRPAGRPARACGPVLSKSQARKDVEAGGVYLNSVRVSEAARRHHCERPAVRQIRAPAQGKRTYAVLRCA